MKHRVPSHGVWALAVFFVCVSACDACNEEEDPTGGPRDGSVPDAGEAGATGRGGVSGGGSGARGIAGSGGFSGFAGFGGGFTVPPPGFAGTGGNCFECGNGCFDCGMGCQCTFDPTKVAPWQPPFTSIGTPGWQDSTMPFCGGVMETFAMDVWADSTGVYAAVVGLGQPLGPDVTDDDAGVASTSVDNPFAGPFGPGDPRGRFPGMFPIEFPNEEANLRTLVWHNEGNGWGLRLEGAGGAFQFGITGVDRGPLMLYSSPQSSEEFSCRLGMTTRGGFRCLDVDPVQDVFVVNDSLAYALMGGARVLVYNGSEWRNHPTPLPYPAQRLWADENDLVAVGTAGTLLRFKGDHWELEDVGALENLTAIWGSAADDLWVGTGSGKLLHYDGASWRQRGEIRGQTCDSRQPVLGIWGTGGVIYAHTPTAVVRWKNGELSTLGNWTCGLATTQVVRSLWGRSENDVFVALSDQSFGNACGTTFVAHFDGTQFHRM
jgi:hypothetical protein